MKKSYFLGLALLLCAANGRAQVAISSFAELKAAKDSVGKIASHEQILSDTKATYNSLVSGAMGIKPTETETKTEYFKKGSAEKNKISAFTTKLLQGKGDNVTLKIKREIVSGGFLGGTTTLYIYSEKQNVADAVNLSTTDVIDASGTVIAGGNNEVTTIIYYFENYDGKTYEEHVYNTTSENGPKTDKAVLLMISDCVSKMQIENEPHETTVTTKNEAYLTAKAQIAANETRQSFYTALLDGGIWKAKSVAWNTEGTDVVETTTVKGSFVGCRNYKNLQLNSEISIESGFTMGDMASDYKFDGGGFNIALNGTTLFGTNNGSISNVVATGGNLATTNAANITDVTITGGKVVGTNNGNIENANVSNGVIATNNGSNSHITNSIESSNNVYKVYGSDASFATVKAADASTYYNIYNNKTLRDEFGVAVGTGIVSKGSNNKLYEVKMYHAGNKTGETRLANINGNGKPEIRRTWGTTGVGEFYYISDADAGSVFDGITGDNIEKNVVYTHDGSNWECKVAEVSNGANSIYIPRAFTAATVKYDRNFNVSAQNASTICLPFAVSASVVESALGTNGHLLQFNKIDENGQTYWFKYVTGGIEANQPYVLLFGQDVDSKFFDGLSNVEFAATGEGQDLKALSQSSVAAGASLYGTFEKRTASELEDGAKHSIYGFQNGLFVRMTDKVNFNPTRAYVRNDKWTPLNTPNAAKAYKLGILDENGNEVTGINSVEDAADEFTVNGGNGAISINADKAQNVKVYTVGGALVKSVDVEAGATSLPVSAGMYIVNGNKVVVK